MKRSLSGQSLLSVPMPKYRKRRNRNGPIDQEAFILQLNNREERFGDIANVPIDREALMPQLENPENESDNIVDVPIEAQKNEEEMMLQRGMAGLNIEEIKAADNTVLGYSATAIEILNKFAERSDNADNPFRGIPEDPDFLSRKFGELDQEIKMIEDSISSRGGSRIRDSISSRGGSRRRDSISSRGGSRRRDPDVEAYKLAKEQDPKFVDHPLFKVGFLRADRYNTKRAAERLLRYLQEKLELFGKEKLTHDIFLSDLGTGGKKYLESGHLQVLPKRDNVERKIVFIPWMVDNADSDEEMLSVRRAYFYFCQSLTEDDDDHGRVMGVVVIMWKVHGLAASNIKKAKALSKIWTCSPLKTSAFHVCHGPTKSRFSLTKINAFAKRNLAFWFKDSYLPRLYRSHYGEAVECMYTLLTKYGCPADCFPLNYKSSMNNFPELEEAEYNCTDSNVLLTSQQFHLHHVVEWLAYRMVADDHKKMLIESIKSSDGAMDTSITNSRLGSWPSLDNSSRMTFSTVMANSPGGSPARKKGRSVGISMTGGLIEGPDSAKESHDSTKESSQLSFSSVWKNSSVYSSNSEKISLNSIDSAISQLSERLQSLKEELSSWGDNESSLLEILEDIDIDWEPDPQVGMKGESKTSEMADVIPECDTTPKDIKGGRGKPLQRHPGNIWYRELIQENFEAYDAMKKQDQTDFAKSLVKKIENEGRRFLKPHPDPKLNRTHWLQLDGLEARTKVSINLRSERAKRKKEVDKKKEEAKVA